MKRFKINIILSLVALTFFWLMFQNCGQRLQSLDENLGFSTNKMELLEEKINQILQEDTCEHHSECGFMPMGSKACGGPRTYILLSSRSNTKALAVLIEEYNETERRYNIENEIISDCMMVMPPERLSCVDNKCIADNLK